MNTDPEYETALAKLRRLHRERAERQQREEADRRRIETREEREARILDDDSAWSDAANVFGC